MNLNRRLVPEFLGTALLLAAVVGSGIMGQRLSQGNDAIALLANSIATGVVLAGLISTFGPLSGAHFNPLVTAIAWLQNEIPVGVALRYVLTQVAGAFIGVAGAHLMFDIPMYQISTHERSGAALVFSEAVATFGLILTILLCRGKAAAPLVIAGYIVGAYWFTSSTSFANPAVTMARAFTDTFAGIRPLDVPAFVAGQIFGAAAAACVRRELFLDKGDAF